MNISALSNNLKVDPSGIWVSSSSGDELSYPEEGNRKYFGIEDRSFWFRHRNDCIVSAMKLHPPDGTVLDIGGGNGFVTRRLIDEGFSAVLLEPGPEGAFNARTERHIPDVICAKLEDCDFPENSISAVALFDVLEHIEDDRAFLNEVHRCLKPGGKLYVTVPGFKWLWSGSDVSAGHYRRYSSHELVRSLSNYFDILFITCIFHVLTLPMLLVRVLPYHLGIKRDTELLKTESEHGADGGVIVRTVQRILSSEAGRIAKGQSMRIGTSCLCIARKRIAE